MTTIACIVIAGGKRTALLNERVLPSVRSQGFDEVVVVGAHHTGWGYRYLEVPDLTGTTVDALVKRDVGTLATTADVLFYLSDDHAVLPGMRTALDAVRLPWDVLVPARFTDHPEHGLVRIPNGEADGYCAGHGGIFRRDVVQWRPWTAQQHHRNWDVLASRQQIEDGFVFVNAMGIQDLEPEREPWK